MDLSYYEAVMRLIGPVRPVGDESVDPQRFENLRELTHLVNELVVVIDEIATENADRHEASRKRAGQHCKRFIDETLGIED